MKRTLDSIYECSHLKDCKICQDLLEDALASAVEGLFGEEEEEDSLEEEVVADSDDEEEEEATNSQELDTLVCRLLSNKYSCDTSETPQTSSTKQ